VIRATICLAAMLTALISLAHGAPGPVIVSGLLCCALPSVFRRR